MATEPKHDVFICFRGRDCRDEFLPNLVKSLKRAGIVPFLDEDTEKGVGIRPQLLAAIEEFAGVSFPSALKLKSKIPPDLRSDPKAQPYRFESTLTMLNNGLEELKSWQVFVGFQHDEYLVFASNAVLADGSSVPGLVGNGTVFAGYPSGDLKTGIETAGDLTQMSARGRISWGLEEIIDKET
ncbi:hypothetical protein RJ640_022530 [Escallonia rubra]|uniref:TIR domain-containing protein n=1 Tax=Escallonia rubra TaxID=112253 RepID=A0AA88RFW9_9ASTE|nr:hypothetical protein RJ640_022530 [Escallonia rubra]